MVSHGVAAVLRGATVVGKVIGRKFFAGFGETAIDQSVWSASLIVGLAAALLDWIDPFAGVGESWQPGVWSTKQAAFMPFTGEGLVNLLDGYQRRRQPGAGE